MESATKGRFPGKGIFSSLPLAESAGISTCTLHSSTGVPERASGMNMDASRNYRDFWHFLPPALLPSPHPPLCTKERCGCQFLYQTDLTHPTSFSLRLESVPIYKAMGKKRHHVQKTRHIPNQTRRWHRDSILLCCWASETQLCSSISQGISCHGCFWKEEATIPTTQLNTIQMHWEVQTYSELSSENVLYSREVWRVPTYYYYY